jgi:hypothetical protein
MITDRVVLAEGFTNIVAGAGLWYYLFTILINGTRSLLERRLTCLLAVVGSLFLLRGVGYTAEITPVLSPYIFLLSIFFPLATVLFSEALLRKHVPLPLKILLCFSTIALAPFAFLEVKTAAFYACLVTYQAVVMIWLAYLTITRDKKSLSEAENRLINGVSIACAVAIPLLMSDYRSVFGWHFMRLGALGGLVFCLSTIKFSEKASKLEVGREFVHILLTDLLGTLLFCLIWSDFDYFGVAYATFMTMHLLILILKELSLLKVSKMQDWIFALTEAIEKGQVRTVTDLHQWLSRQLGSTSLVFLNEDSMAEFDVQVIREFIANKSELSLTELRSQLSLPAAQQLIYALESHQMNGVHVVGLNPLLLIFTNTPSFKGAAAYEKEMKILKSFIALLQRKSA